MDNQQGPTVWHMELRSISCNNLKWKRIWNIYNWITLLWITMLKLTQHCKSNMLLLFSPSVVSNSLWPHGLQHTRLPCPSPTHRVCSNSCPLSQWSHPTISSSVVPFSSCLLSFLESGSFPISQLFTSGGQSIGASASASVLPMNIQGWFPLRSTSLLSLLSKELSFH